MTFDDLRLSTIRAAKNLQRRGFRSRQVFGFLAGDSDHLASILMASICLTCPIAPMHPMLSKQEIVCFLGKTKPTVIFCDASSCHQLMEALEELNFKVEVFTFHEKFDGLEQVDDLLVGTGDENNFVWVFDLEEFVSCKSIRSDRNCSGIYCR